MNLPNIWGAGSIFALSGVSGPCTLRDAMVGQLMGDFIGVDFDNHAVQLLLRTHGVHAWEFSVVASDLISGTLNGGAPFTLAFAEQDTVVGCCPERYCLPVCHGDLLQQAMGNEVQLLIGRSVAYAFAREVREETVYFVLVRDRDARQAELRAQRMLAKMDIAALQQRKLAFFRAAPQPVALTAHAERTLLKCYSVMKSQVYTAEGRIEHRWTTPDRVPHRYLWLWDSVFHSFGNVYIDPALARESLLAVLDSQGEDGFIPHMMLPDRASDVTQPPVLAWGFLRLFEKEGDANLLFFVFERLKRYLAWNMEYRDDNRNGLYEWYVDPNDPGCRCGESGMDNSPRFDAVQRMDCVDFSCFMANEMRCMERIALELGQTQDAAFYAEQYRRTADAIEAELYDERDGRYYDREIASGQLKRVSAVSSFLPLFAGACSREHAARLVEDLFDPTTFGTAVGVPSIAVSDPTFGSDMWRGPVWINYNYMIIRGLRDYGYDDAAERLRRMTLQTIEKWYAREGSVFEFYDCSGEVSPTLLPRKGAPLRPTDAFVRYPSIRDYGWTATLYVALRME